MFKKLFFLGITAGILTAIAGIIYNRVYFVALGADFSKIVNYRSIAGISIAVCLLAAFLFWTFGRLFKSKGEIIFNFTLAIFSFAAILLPIKAKLPLDIESPELFPGLVVPMLFFPALAWFTLKPLFINAKTSGV